MLGKEPVQDRAHAIENMTSLNVYTAWTVTRMKFVGNYYYNSLLLFTMVKLYSIGSKAVVKNFLQDVIICVTYYIVGATLELLMR